MSELVTIREPVPEDVEGWTTLYSGYADFYGVHQDDAMRTTVWSWIHDPASSTRCLLAETDDGLVGLAHTRPFARPLSASVGEYLDDLFVLPSARGLGIASALIAAIDRRAAAEGRSVVRWITREDNVVARRLYDELALATSWVTYDLTPAVAPTA